MVYGDKDISTIEGIKKMIAFCPNCQKPCFAFKVEGKSGKFKCEHEGACKGVEFWYDGATRIVTIDTLHILIRAKNPRLCR